MHLNMQKIQSASSLLCATIILAFEIKYDKFKAIFINSETITNLWNMHT